MKRTILAFCLFLLPFLATAQDGLPSGVPFDLPLIVGGKATTGKALIQASTDPEKPLVVFYATADGKIGVMAYWIRRGDSPSPTPNPQPEPKPDPKPTPKLAFLYLIHESKDSTPTQALVRDDKSWRDACEARGIRWLVMDVDEAVKKFPIAAAKAKATGLPCIVWLDSQGVAESATQPKTADELIAEINRRAK